MSRKLKPKAPAPKPESGAAQPPVPAVKFWTLLAAAVLAGLVLLVWSRKSAVPQIPQLNLQNVEPSVRETITARLNEVVQQPQSGPAWGWLGALLWAYDFRPAACECLLQAERLDPSNPRWPYFHALTLLIATPNQAIPFIQAAVRLCGTTPPAPRYRLAHLLAEQGRWQESRRELDLLLRDDPGFTPARLLAGRDRQQQGDLDAALELARGCVDDPRTARSALILLSSLYQQKGNADASRQAAERAARLPPDQGIEDPFQAEVALLRGDPRVLSEQAHPLLAAGQLDAATALIARLEREHPGYAETWLLAGRLELLRKNLPAAEQDLRRHLGLSPRSVQGLFQLGLVYMARQSWTNAAATFEQAIEVKSDFGPAHFNRGVSLARAGQLRPAIDSLQESLRHNPERLETYLLLAEFTARSGDRSRAGTLLDQAGFLFPADPRLQRARERLDSARLAPAP